MSEPEPGGLVPLTLVPVEVFGAEDGYGLSDAVQAWSDCNRAIGRVYRVDDTPPQYRQPRETVTVYVPRDQVAWFEREWGEDVAGDRAAAPRPKQAPSCCLNHLGPETLCLACPLRAGSGSGSW